MIIATSLKYVFANLKVDVVNEGNPVNQKQINFHYGDQKELLLWVKLRGNLDKYPLVWYVLNKFTEHNGWYDVDARIVIMQKTKIDPLNTWRAENSYVGIIDPVTKEVKRLLLQNPYVQVYSNDTSKKFIERDEPNYGIQSDNDEKTSSTQSISSDIVDARILTFKMRIKPQCLIPKTN